MTLSLISSDVRDVRDEFNPFMYNVEAWPNIFQTLWITFSLNSLWWRIFEKILAVKISWGKWDFGCCFCIYPRGVFRTQSNIYYGVIFLKRLHHKWSTEVVPSEVPKADRRAAIKQSNKIWKKAKVFTLLHCTKHIISLNKWLRILDFWCIMIKLLDIF